MAAVDYHQVVIEQELFEGELTALGNEVEEFAKKSQEVPPSAKLLEWKERFLVNKEELERCNDQVLAGVPKEDYRETKAAQLKFQRIVCRINSILVSWSPEKEKPKESSSHNGSADTSQFKLPKIELRRFSGVPSEWAQFWDQFSKCVHENPTISPVNKLVHIRSLLSGTAYNAISGLPLSDANYTIAVDLLTRRFGNTDVAAHEHLHRLTCAKPVSDAGDVQACRKLLDYILCHLSALDNLDIPRSSFAMSLYSVLLKVLPSSVVLEAQKRQPRNDDQIIDDDPEVVFNVGSASVVDACADQCSYLLNCFRQEVETRERFALVSRAAAGSDTLQVSRGNHKHSERRLPQPRQQKEPQTSGAALRVAIPQSNNNYACLFCNSDKHLSEKCNVEMSTTDRIEVVKKARCCFKCLKKSHYSRDCRIRNIKCDVCGRGHLTIMHNDNLISKGNASEKVATKACVSDGPKVFLQTATANVRDNAESVHLARILFDTGSHASFIASELARKLDLPVVRTVNMSIYPFGSKTPIARTCNVLKLSILSKVSDELVVIDVIEIDNLGTTIETLPSQQVLKGVVGQNLVLADETLTGAISPGIDVNILIGSDSYNKFVTGKRVPIADNLFAMETKLNWTLIGSAVASGSAVCQMACIYRTTLVNDAGVQRDIDALWSNEHIGIERPVEKVSTQRNRDMMAVEFFESSIERVGSRYQVRLPWNDSPTTLANNYSNALHRARSVQRKMLHLNQLSRYELEVERYLVEEHAERVPLYDSSSAGMRYYMPHHPVFRDDKETTALRVVFDCSSSTKDSRSLNECLLPGPNLNPDLTSLLIKFRHHNVAIMGDIQQAFLQILVHPDDRDFLRYVWFEDGLSSIYRMTVLPFGLTCSPFLLSSVIKHHISAYKDNFPQAFHSLNSDLYVDDLLTGANSCDEAFELYQACTTIMADAGMSLRKWVTNDIELRSRFKLKGVEQPSHHSGIFKVLGVTWDVNNDELVMTHAIPESVLGSEPTKRNVLKITASVFDPLGFLSPFMVKAKLLIQRLWSEKIDWDTKIDGPNLVEWVSWCDDLANISNIRIPRNYRNGLGKNCIDTQLHIFTDASEKAYAAVAYLRCVDDNSNVTVNLIMSKSRVASLERMTIPRLELMGALIGSRLRVHLVDSGAILANTPTYMWSDSTVALHWIRGNADQWQAFVSNRVVEIKRNTDPLSWRYCPGSLNPADIPSRGASINQLQHSRLWKHGPEFLLKSEECWPQNIVEPLPSNDDMDKERRKNVVVNATAVTEPVIDFSRFGSFSKLVRTIAAVQRFAYNCKNPAQRKTDTYDAHEIEDAEGLLIRETQRQGFALELACLQGSKPLPEKSAIKKYSPFVDEQGFLRVGGRLNEARLTLDERHPIILPANNHIVELFILSEHNRLGHVGATTLLSHIRVKFWIVRGRQQIRSLINRCVVCKRFLGTAGSQQVAPLPSDRTTESDPFENVGIDFAGPIFVKIGPGKTQKSYLCLFTCAVSRAVHLELVSSLSTGCFLQALRRFIARRGIPKVVYTDNALTFKRASKDIEQLFLAIKDKATKDYFASHHIQWKFIMPYSSWWGGFYERMVRTVKSVLKKVLGKSLLTFESLTTVLHEVEALINSRPLTQVSDDPLQPAALTPADLLLGRRITQLPYGSMQSEQNLSGDELNKRYKRRQQVVNDFWKRWRSEYLLLLRSANEMRPSAERIPKVGDVVLLLDANRPRNTWKMGLIVKHIIGRDEKVRSVEVRLSSGSLLRRSVQLVYPLEVAR